MNIAWFSCGITSAMACKIAVDTLADVVPVYIEIDTAHPDNDRFIAAWEAWVGVPVLRRRSVKYTDQFDVINKRRFINGPSGALCTHELKKVVRQAVEKEFAFTAQVFGFEFDKQQVNRAIRFKQQYPNTQPLFPLIERQMTKANCAAVLLKAGIELPAMYHLGYHNNNCIGCVKGGKGYWNKIRRDFPGTFERMSSAERTVGRSCIRDTFLDELPEDAGRHDGPIELDCGTFCEIEFADLLDPQTIQILNGTLFPRDVK